MSAAFWKFVQLALSRPLLTVKLVRPRRIKNALGALTNNSGNLEQLYRRYEQIYSPLTNVTHNSCKSSSWRGDLIVFPIIDWHFRFQRPQHIAIELAKIGYRVFYLSTTPLTKDVADYYKVYEVLEQNVFLVQVASGTSRFPDIHRDKLTQSEIKGYSESLRILFQKFNVSKPVAILHHPFWYSLIKEFPEATVGYDCFDQHAAFYSDDENAPCPEEDVLVKEADFVTASSAVLCDRISHIRNCALIRNGCEFSRFSNVTQACGSHRPTAGYIGAISRWFDADLIGELATLLPNWDFVLVGSTAGCEISKIARLSNVKMMGEIDYVEIPTYIASFDVCLIPFKISALTKATNPVKLYEYLAAGRPVVATPLPELLDLAHTVDGVLLAEDPKGFAQAIKSAQSTSQDRDAVELMKRWAANCDWSARADAFASVIDKVVSCRGKGVQ